MKKNPAYKWIHFLLVFLLILIVQIAVAQNKKIEITFLGNCGLFMTDGEINLYVDFPYKSGAYGYMTYDPELLDNILPIQFFFSPMAMPIITAGNFLKIPIRNYMGHGR